ncbi:pseudouridine synthase [Herbaspirillum sp. RTI4]|uniref:pseudouridine synthase n=1 Tax=Herbaspirillum sp. RTI4 TaxID=3048640 RepID=UPI002AB3FD57|nr:pseudouridine synthase [Herbaspirillum sp. RTI4]MDY7578904.1 pseudouridine synthase [Herbaspirillum sp. RTI4]MEA9981993.1 pseudouridine synthase [Herbaspirillum sp. RTI4]
MNNRCTPPLPLRDGVSPSYLWLPEGDWPDMATFLVSHFPGVSAAEWAARMRAGEVVDQHGNPFHAHSPYRRGDCVYYYRTLDDEESIPVTERILFQDEHLLVADKPHFLPVIPSGRFLQQTLLVRLKKSTGLEHLSPLHRIDRETAGLVLFSTDPSTRGLYQSMFQKKTMQKTYEAIAASLRDTVFPITHCSRMIEGEPFFRMQEVPGTPNSETRIDCIEKRGELSLYRLNPVTGKRHQLRVHLAGLGMPILNDQFYPHPVPVGHQDDFTKPLKLLAKAISFTDPLSGLERYFESRLSLDDAV